MNNNLFEKVICPENLFFAWGQFRKGKKTKKDILLFESCLEENIFRLHRELKTKTYRHGLYKGFYISDPKRRHIHKATVRDRVLHHAVFNILEDVFEPAFISDSFSCRVGKGTHKGVERVQAMLRQVSKNNTKPCYALKCDVRKFFDSIDHAILFDLLKEKINDDDFLWLLAEIIESYGSLPERERERVNAVRVLAFPSATSPAKFSLMFI